MRKRRSGENGALHLWAVRAPPLFTLASFRAPACLPPTMTITGWGWPCAGGGAGWVDQLALPEGVAKCIQRRQVGAPPLKGRQHLCPQGCGQARRPEQLWRGQCAGQAGVESAQPAG